MGSVTLSTTLVKRGPGVALELDLTERVVQVPPALADALEMLRAGKRRS